MGIKKEQSSNFQTNRISICPKWRKPFDLMAKGLSHSVKLPLMDEFCNWLETDEKDEILSDMLLMTH